MDFNRNDSLESFLGILTAMFSPLFNDSNSNQTIWMTAVGLFQGIATIAVAVVLYRQSKVFKSVEMQGQAINAMNFLNSVAVQSKENLIAFDTLGRQQEESEALRRARWCAFAWLESLQHIYLADEKKLIDRGYATQALEQQLNVLLREDLAFWLATYRGFHPSFSEYCRTFRKQHLGLSDQMTEEEAVSSWHKNHPEIR